MAKEFYIPVNGFSKETSKFYAPVNGFSKEIIKAYCSVNGFSKLFYEKGGGGGSTGFWFYYKTTSGQIIEYRMVASPPPLGTDIVAKINSGIAFYCISLDSNGACVITFSTDSNAVAYTDTYRGYVFNPTTGNVTINNEVWYYAYRDLRPNASATDITPNCAIEDSSFTGNTPQQIVTQIINSRIYTDDFAEDYILETPYNLRKGDKEKTIRKALAIWLYKNFAQKNNASYIALLTNIDTIVSTMLSNVSNYDVIDIVIYQNYNVIRIEYSYSNASSDNKSLMSKNTEFGYTWYQLRSSMSESGGKYVQIDTSGNIIYRNNYGTYTSYVGANISLYYDNAYRVILTNLGLNL